jgi:hypothetical protein
MKAKLIFIIDVKDMETIFVQAKPKLVTNTMAPGKKTKEKDQKGNVSIIMMNFTSVNGFRIKGMAKAITSTNTTKKGTLVTGCMICAMAKERLLATATITTTVINISKANSNKTESMAVEY